MSADIPCTAPPIDDQHSQSLEEMIDALNAFAVACGVLLFLLAHWLLLSPLGQFTPVHREVAPVVTTAIVWSFTDVAREGQNGFTCLVTGQAGPNGTAVVYGDRGGETGLFRIDGGSITEIAIDNTELPGGLGTLRDLAANGSLYEVLPNGDVLFQGGANGGSLPVGFYTFRWSAGVISLEAPFEPFDDLNQLFDHSIHQTTSNNRWLSSLRSAGSNPTFAYALTNGTLPTQSLFSFTQTAANCVFNNAPMVAVNPNGIAAFYEVQETGAGPALMPSISLSASSPRKWSGRLGLAGGATGTIASGSAFHGGGSHSGNDSSVSSELLLNSQNHAAAVRASIPTRHSSTPTSSWSSSNPVARRLSRTPVAPCRISLPLISTRRAVSSSKFPRRRRHILAVGGAKPGHGPRSYARVTPSSPRQ